MVAWCAEVDGVGTGAGGAISSISTSLCPRCENLPWSGLCKRRQTAKCFDAHTGGSCQACFNNQNTTVRKTSHDIVTEYNIQSDKHDRNFEQFIECNAAHIRQIVIDQRQRLRSSSTTTLSSGHDADRAVTLVWLSEYKHVINFQTALSYE